MGEAPCVCLLCIPYGGAFVGSWAVWQAPGGLIGTGRVDGALPPDAAALILVNRVVTILLERLKVDLC